MRTVTSYYLLLLYLTVMFKPLIPVIENAAAHFFTPSYHEAVVHARYGERHLDVEIAGTNTGNDKMGEQNRLLTGETVPIHLPCTHLSFLFSVNGIKSLYSLPDCCSPPAVFLSDPTPPPRQA